MVKASASVGANYIEANESFGKKDFLMKLRISRKEAKEAGFFLRLLAEEEQNEPFRKDLCALVQEAYELRCIFSAIINNSGG